MIRDRVHLADLVARARAAGIRKAFIVGGDATQVGELRDGLDLLRALDDIGHPFEEVGVPSYPEGHVSIPDDVLLRVLKEKQQHADSMTTQMSFNPGAVASWVARVREQGIVLPIHLGIPGVMQLHKLLTVGARIGIASSTRYLLKHRGLLGRLVTSNAFGPDALLAALAETVADPRANVRALHVFTMNQVAETVKWQRSMMDELGR
jgi:methylenetetrahydrofolate reductase (NADPH)